MKLGLNKLGLSNTSAGGGGGGTTFMHDTIASTECELDSFLTECYSGSGQSFTNATTSPASGAAQSGYDLYLGADGTASTDDPTYGSSVFTLDGGDFFKFQNNLTTFAGGLHKATAGNAWTMIWAIKTATLATTPLNYMFESMAAGAGRRGLRIRYEGTDLVLNTKGDATTPITSLPVGDLGDNTDVLIAMAYDYDTTTVYYSVNGATFSSASHTASGTDAATNDPANLMSFYSGGNGWEAGTIFRGFYVFNEVLSNAQLASVSALLETRHGVDYTP